MLNSFNLVLHEYDFIKLVLSFDDFLLSSFSFSGDADLGGVELIGGNTGSRPTSTRLSFLMTSSCDCAGLVRGDPLVFGDRIVPDC